MSYRDGTIRCPLFYYFDVLPGTFLGLCYTDTIHCSFAVVTSTRLYILRMCTRSAVYVLLDIDMVLRLGVLRPRARRYAGAKAYWTAGQVAHTADNSRRTRCCVATTWFSSRYPVTSRRTEGQRRRYSFERATDKRGSGGHGGSGYRHRPARGGKQ